MRHAFTTLALILLAACGPAAQGPAPSPTPSATPSPAPPMPDQIGMTRDGPWGQDWHEWLIDANGAVKMRSVEGNKTRAVRFTMPPAEFLAIRAMLLSLEQRRSGLPMDACSTDQGGAFITWHYGKRNVDLGIDNGCSGGIYDTSFATLDTIRQKLDTLGNAAPDRQVTISAH